MAKVRNFTSVQSEGSYHKTVQVEHHDAYGSGFLRIETQCPGKNIGNARFNLSITGARRLRDALISLFPLPAKTTQSAASVPASLKPKGAQEYKGNGKHDWETVGSESMTGTRRLRVPGGWLYRVGYAPMTTFVAMPEVVGYKI